MELTKKTFLERLQHVQAEIAVIVQCAEVSVLVNCDHYHPRVSLPDALLAITETINAWADYQHDENTIMATKQ